MNRRSFLAMTAACIGCRHGQAVKTGNVVVIGDSIPAATHVDPGEGYVELAAAQLPSLTFHNIAVASSSIDSANQRAAAAALVDTSKQVNACYIAFGANDGLTKTASEFLSDLSDLVAGLRSDGFNKILVATMTPCGSYDSVAFRAAINAGERSDPSVYDRLVDLGDENTTMGTESAKNDGTLYSDTVHPTAAGNVLLEPAFTAAIRSVMFGGKVLFKR